MTDLFTAVRSIRSQPEDDDRLDELRPASSTVGKATSSGTKAGGNGITEKRKEERTTPTPTTAEEALQLLRSQPELPSLLAVLKQLHSHAFQPALNIHAPGPLQAQIINALLTITVPDYWEILRERHASSLTACLRNVAGLNATIARLRLLSSKGKAGSSAQPISDLLGLVAEMFNETSTLLRIHVDLCAAVSNTKERELSWKEVVTLIGSGKVPSTLAQAEDTIQQGKSVPLDLANAGMYAKWLGRNIATLASGGLDSNATLAASQVVAKSITIGYPSQLLQGIFQTFAKSWRDYPQHKTTFISMVHQLPPSAKRMFLEHLARWLSNLPNSNITHNSQDSTEQTKEVGILSSLLRLMVSQDASFTWSLTFLLTDPGLSSLLSYPMRKASVLTLATLNTDCEEIQTILEKLMSTFNDRLFIAHAPVIQQESFAQTILLSAGYLHRQVPMALLMTARSSNHMHGVSNRLDSSNARARWLGMVVGTAISSLVDKDGMKMSFGTEDMATAEANWYLSLVLVQDDFGDVGDLETLIASREQRPRNPTTTKTQELLPIINGKQTFGPARPPTQTKVIGERLTEILGSDDDDDDDGLKPYAKPDSDPEDSDEDATLVNRKKARAPVYIRDLMAMLRDDQNHDRFQFGIKHAAGLIRRKTSFGSEVADHSEEIGVILCNLQDPFETDDFDTLKLQAMIAVILSSVGVMAPWFCRQAFVGNYSLAQRCSILSALGLSGRELAGLKHEDGLNADVDIEQFPSKRLHPRLHAMYSHSTNRLNAASQNVEHALIKPLALQAADNSTAHLNTVKVRSFSSRADAERTKRRPAPNALAKIFGEAFFFPLVNCYQQDLAAYGLGSVYASVPIVLVTFIKTVALLLHGAGIATLGLSELSGEFWDLLLSLRTQASQDITQLHAVLFSLLIILELNPDQRRVVQEHPKRLVETQQWVELVFDRMGGGRIVGRHETSEEDKVRTLAAGVLLKTKEIIGDYQRELVGYDL